MNRKLRRVIQIIKELDAGKNIAELTDQYNLTKSELSMIIHMIKERDIQKTISA